MITTQPSNQLNVNENTNAVFTVVASGIMLMYQWRRNDVDISNTADLYSGTDMATLTVLSVGASDAGAYSVAVSNAAAQVVSSPAAQLTVCKL